MGWQFPEGSRLELAATDLILTTRCQPGQVGHSPLHRFGTDLLDTRADRW